MTGNPTLNANTFTGIQATPGERTMTVQGTVHKTALLLLLTILSASYAWGMYYKGESEMMPMLLGVGAIGGFIVAMITVFKKTWSPVTAPLYALFEGLVVGGLSAMFAGSYQGIVIQAVMLTFGVLAALLAAYTFGLVKASQNFVRGVVAATGGIMLLYLATFVLGFFGIQMPAIYGNGPIGIGFSVVVVIIAALNLVIDFDFIETGAKAGAPKYLEWYAAFSLLVTLIWLYLEILRLLAKLSSRRK
ncbi:MAG: Bax inhibitor-1/YccA family protein [Chthoniobacteraceae bacterium]|jgi:uncharacterized YccA/Bax inhibitor family protein